MPQPPKYQRKKDFALDEPASLEVSAINAELDGVSNSIEGIRRNLALIQTDEGGLVPRIVTYESLAPDTVKTFEGVVSDYQNKASQSAMLSEQFAKESKRQADISLETKESVERLAEATRLNTEDVARKTADVTNKLALTNASRDAAAESERKAKISETNAKTSELNAKESETNSKASEEESIRQAKVAVTAHEGAKTAQQKAEEQNRQAQDAASRAKASQNASALSEQNASTSETNAKQSELHAKSSETNALASEKASAQSEANASTSEKKAKASEQNASASEARAKTSETNAKKSEVNAKSSETVALTKANEANVSATTALNAKQASETARDQAQEAAFNATNNQKQADWSVTSPDDKAFIRNKPTTIAGFGITDAYTKGEVDDVATLIVQNNQNAYKELIGHFSELKDDKADKATTLAGYGITDAYTKAEINGNLWCTNFTVKTDNVVQRNLSVQGDTTLKNIISGFDDGHINFVARNGGGWYLNPDGHQANAWEHLATENWVRANIGLAIPAGTICFYAGTNVPGGWVLCNGMALDRTQYAALFAAIGTRYGAGNGSTTFNVPNIHHRFLETTTAINEVGQFVEAGLPNITGQAALGTYWSYGSEDAHSALYRDHVNNHQKENNGNSGGDYTFFNAGRNNGLYGRSSTVQPYSVRFLPIIKT